jgi:hypothetical protein
VHDARHRDVRAARIVERRQRHLVEPVDVDRQIELLPDRQEVAQDQELLRLLVAFVREAERHDLAAAIDRRRRQTRQQPIGPDLAEPRGDRSAEDADEQLPLVGARHRVVARGREPEIVGRGGRRRIRRLRRAQRRRQIERDAGLMRGPEVGVERHRGEAPARRLRHQLDLRPVRIDVIEPAGVKAEDGERDQFGRGDEDQQVDDEQRGNAPEHAGR